MRVVPPIWVIEFLHLDQSQNAGQLYISQVLFCFDDVLFLLLVSLFIVLMGVNELRPILGGDPLYPGFWPSTTPVVMRKSNIKMVVVNSVAATAIIIAITLKILRV